MRVGDFIYAVGKVDTRWSKHEDVVAIIRDSGDILKLKLITPRDKNYLDPSLGKPSASGATASPPASPSHTDESGGSTLPRKGILKNSGGKAKAAKPKSPWILRRKRSRSVEKEKKRKEVLERS